MMELTSAIARHLVSVRFDDLPEEAIEVTKRSILDTLGLMFAATSLEKACAALADIARDAGGKEESTLVGFGGKLPCWSAAWVNGSLPHALDYDETTDHPPHHPTSCTLPAALALAEKVGGVSGKEFITAVALGNDLGVRLAAAPRGRLLQDYPWFCITAVGVPSATATAGRVLGLSQEQMVNALGITVQRVFGITEVMASPDSEIRAIRDGYTNKEGVVSALMAQKGISACKDGIEKFFKVFYRDNHDPGALTADLGTHFRGSEVAIKAWPCARENHGYVNAALDLANERDLQPEQIAEVTLTVGPFVRDFLCEPLDSKRSPTISIDAKFALPFIVAVALAKRSVTIADFLPEGLRNPQALDLAKRVTYKVDPSFDVIAPGVIDVKTTDGKLCSKRVDAIYGSPEHPMSTDDLIGKFRDCVGYSRQPVAPDRVERLIERVLHLERLADVRELTAGLQPRESRAIAF